MESRHVTYILTGMAVILAVVAIFLTVKQDKKAPVITVGKTEISYIDGNDKQELLKDVKAEDDKDGDLSDQIFVERLIDLKDGRANVIYAVVDQNKNVGKANRIISYTTNSSVNETVSIETENQEEEAQMEKKEIIQSGKNPAIWLTQNKVTIKQGEKFNELSYIKDVQDDKDEKSELNRRISIEGEYYTNKKGEYILKYFVLDSDKNQSNIEKLILTVE